MRQISNEALNRLRENYPINSRVELIKMNDPYNNKLVPGCRGTVKAVDDIGTIHVQWDCGSSLGVVYGEDACKKLDSVKIICYNQEKIWDSRDEALKFYTDAIINSMGAEQDRYIKICGQIIEGRACCNGDEIDTENKRTDY